MNNWFFAALAFVCICNVLFLVGAATLLHRIVSATEDSRRELLKAAKDSAASANELMTMSSRAVAQMERASEAQIARENSSGRVISELSRQIRALGDRIQDLQGQTAQNTAAQAQAHQRAMDKSLEDTRIGPDERAMLRSELNLADAKNKKLLDEISQVSYKLHDATARMNAMREELNHLADSKDIATDRFINRIDELQTQLDEARKRAKTAELLAEENAMRLADMQESMTKGGKAGPSSVNSVEASESAADHFAALQDQQDQIDAMANREKALMARLTAMEEAFQRNQAEKAFIEERYLAIDAGQEPSATEPTSDKAAS